jgi:integrase
VTAAKSLVLRYGARRQIRLTVPAAIATKSRIDRLRGLAKRLHRVSEAEARVILTEAASADLKTFSVLEAIAREQEAKHADAPRSAFKPAMTFRALGEMWTSGELARDFPDYVKVKRSAGKDALLLEKLYKAVGDVSIVAFTIADAKRAMASLPRGLRSATRRHYAQAMARLLKLAVWPLELIPASPIPKGFLPKVTNRPRPALYPSEDAQLIQCAEAAIEWRALYGLLDREGLRLGNVLPAHDPPTPGLKWKDLDLERGVITLRKTKTVGLSWALRPDVVRTLKWLRGNRWKPEDLVFPTLKYRDAPRLLKAHLRLAGVDRPELFEADDDQDDVCIHALRATFVTVSLAEGRSETWVMDRTGHTTSIMLNRYRRPARRWTELNLGSLLPLDELLGLESGDQASLPPAASGESGPRSGGDKGGDRVTNQKSLASHEPAENKLSSPSRARTGTPKGRGILKRASGCEASQNIEGTSRADAELRVSEHLVTTPEPSVDPVERALARALDAATEAREWTVVRELAGQLDARRLDRSRVTSIETARARREGR